MNATVSEVVTPEMLTFLDELREEGTTNMYGARPYLRAAFAELSEAGAVLAYWMKTFNERKDGGETMGKTRTCAKCGNEFDLTWYDTDICPDCERREIEDSIAVDGGDLE